MAKDDPKLTSSDSHVHYGAGVMTVDADDAMSRSKERLDDIQRLWDKWAGKQPDPKKNPAPTPSEGTPPQTI